jgi:putative membrane protein
VPVLAVVFAALAAAFHVLFFAMESVLWTRPAVWKRFGLATQRDADLTKTLAYNQGFYNLFLAIGTAVGIALVPSDKPGCLALIVFGTGSMLAAALVLITSDRSKARAAAIQGTLPALALLALLVHALR